MIAAMMLAALSASPADGAPMDFAKSAQAACAAPIGERPSIDGILVERSPPLPSDLPSLKVVDKTSGAWMSIYYDPSSERVAWSRAACLGAQLALLHQATGDDRSSARWASVVLTSDGGYIPPRDGVDVRWIVTTTEGKLDDASQSKLVLVIPHEQVHTYQTRAGAVTPRWFHEGHAEWVGRQVGEAISPDLARKDDQLRAEALAISKETVALGRWGGVSVKREAMFRQVGPEDRRRMDADPKFVPRGPFSFGPDDIVSDESNLTARYQAAWTLFHDLEVQQGGNAVRDWAKAATQTKRHVASDNLVASALSRMGVDLAPRLK